MIYKLMDDPQQFNAFVQNHPYSHFQKTSMWGEFIQKTEHNPYRMLGFFEHNQLVATAMLLVKKTLLGHFQSSSFFFKRLRQKRQSNVHHH